MEPKVLIVGKKNSTSRVYNALADNGIPVTFQNEITEGMSLVKNGNFDLVLLDSNMVNLESICYRLVWQYRVPVVLMVKGKETDWNLVKTLDIAGVIPEEGSKAEILAYFNTIARRVNFQPSNHKILVIEDDEKIKASLKEAFQAHWPAVEVKYSATGKEGLLYTRLSPADIIIIDLKLPDISGFEVLKTIRSVSQVPVVVISATGTTEDVVKAIILGANDYIVKPFNRIKLIARIKEQIPRGKAANTVLEQR